MATTQTITQADRFRIAGTAEVDPRTVARYLAGGTVRPLLQARIERALRQLGLAPDRPETQAPAAKSA